MAENTGNDGNRSPSMDEDESTLDDLQKIFNPVRSSASEPAMSSMMPLPMHVPTSAAFTRIVVEPTNHIIRFRYKCEGRTAGSIPGNNSKPEAKTYPTIEIVNYNGPAHVFVSCVTADPPYRQHPHELVSKDEADKCKAGAYIKRLKPGEQRLELQKVGIQCTKKTEVAEALKKRKEKNIDPFRAGFEHAKDVSSINLSQLRLCYHVVIMDEKTKSNIALEPVVSSPIYGKSNDLTITKMCKCSSKSSGGDEIILLCEKVNRNDIKIRFFETNADDVVVWEAYGIFGNHNVYKQTAIAFKTPSYHNKNIQNCVDVEVQLVRPSDGATSAPRVFTYKPNPETMSEQFHQNAIESTELVKRKLAGLASNSKQRRLQPTTTNAQEMSNYFGQTTPFLHSYQTKPSPTGSTFETDVKFEMQFDVDNIPSTSNQEFLTNFPLSPVSSYSTADSISPVQQQQQQPQMQQQLPQQQQQQMYLGSSPSPSFGSEMKYEVPQMQIDSIPTTCVQNICTDFSMSPGSSYSTTDGIAPMMTVQQQQIQQQQQQQQFQQQQQQLPLQNCPNELEMTNALNHMTMQDNSYPSKMMQLSNQVHTKTSFNGGSFIATNSHDVQMNNNNNAFSPNMNTTNLSFSPQNCMPYELNPQQSQSPSQFQQVQYQQQQQQQLMQESQQQQQLQQQQLQQHQQQLAQQQQQHQQQQQQQQLVQQEALDFLGDLGFDNTNITESAEIRYINDLQKTIATLDSQSPT